jgi:hypothetical protein
LPLVPEKRSRSRFFSDELLSPGPGALADTPEIFPGPTHEFVLKTADQVISSDDTLNNDDELFFPVRAGERWEVHLVIQYLATEAADIDFKLDVPGTGATGAGVATRLIVLAVNKEEIFLDNRTDLTEFRAGGIGIAAGNEVVCDWWMNVLVGDADGNITLQWCQGTSGVNDTTVLAGSWMSGRKVS